MLVWGMIWIIVATWTTRRADMKRPHCFNRFKFDDAITAFETTKAGKSTDGKGVIKAIISGPDVSPDDI